MIIITRAWCCNASCWKTGEELRYSHRTHHRGTEHVKLPSQNCKRIGRWQILKTPRFITRAAALFDPSKSNCKRVMWDVRCESGTKSKRTEFPKIKSTCVWVSFNLFDVFDNHQSSCQQQNVRSKNHQSRGVAKTKIKNYTSGWHQKQHNPNLGSHEKEHTKLNQYSDRLIEIAQKVTWQQGTMEELHWRFSHKVGSIRFHQDSIHWMKIAPRPQLLLERRQQAPFLFFHQVV